MTFVFVFMPLVMSIYLLSKKEIRNYVLLAASIIFTLGASLVIWQL